MTTRRPTTTTLAALALVALAWWRMVHNGIQLSPVVDEQSHISRGVSVWRTGELRLTIGHPLLLHLWQALPLAADPGVRLPTDDPSWRRADRWDAFGDAFLWRAYGSPPQQDQPSGRVAANGSGPAATASVPSQPTSRSVTVANPTAEESPSATMSAGPRFPFDKPPRPPADGIVFRARAMILLLALVLFSLVYRWAADLAGPRAGLLALVLASLDPNLLAHGGLATTDLGVTLFTFAAFWALWRRQRDGEAPTSMPSGRKRWLVIAGILAGAALTSKFSALVFVPVWLVLVLSQGGWWSLPIFGATAALTIVLVYLGHVESYFADLRWILSAAEQHPAFLLGQLSDHGWWSYFPITFLLKTPLPTLLVLAWALVVGVEPFYRAIRDSWRKRLLPAEATRERPAIRFRTLAVTRTRALSSRLPSSPVLYLTFPIAVYGAASVASGFNIGYRHLLPILPLAFVAAASALVGTQSPAGLSAITTRRPDVIPPRRGVFSGRLDPQRLAILGLGLWLTATSLVADPNLVAYFNGIAPRPYEALVDSNLDWGQGLVQLARYLKATSPPQSPYLSNSSATPPPNSPSRTGSGAAPRPYLSYFGPGDPEAYGIAYEPLPRWPPPRRHGLRPANPRPGRYIISATNLQGVLLPRRDSFDWFRRRRPSAVLAGGSLLVYEVQPDRHSPRATMLCQEPWSPIEAHEVAGVLGEEAAARIVRIDCRQAWLWPNGATRGCFYLAPPEVFAGRPMLGSRSRLDYRHEPDTAAGAYDVWRQPPLRLGGPLPQLPRGQPPIAFEGNLRLLGTDHPLGEIRLAAGQTLQLMTAWQVTGPITQPVAIFGQLLRADGTLLAGSDGFGVPVGALRPEDVLGIRHRLFIPRDTAAGGYRFQTGYYRLDTGARYRPLSDAEDIADNAVIFGRIDVRSP